MSQNDWELRHALDHFPHLPLKCVTMFVEHPLSYSERHIDSILTVAVSSHTDCFDTLEDINLCGRFSIGDTRYLIKKTTHTQYSSDFVFEAVGVRNENWMTESDGALHRESPVYA